MYYVGIVAVACVHNYDCDERIELYSKLLLEHSLILIWSFVDPIHPQVQFILYMYLCVCVLYACMYIHTCLVCTWGVYMYVHIYMCVHACVCAYTCTHVYVYISRIYPYRSRAHINVWTRINIGVQHSKVNRHLYKMQKGLI